MYREEIALGEKTVADLKRKQAAYEERVNVVATEWNTLQDDIRVLALRVGGEAPSTSGSSGPHADIKDPFLRRLFETAPGATRKRAREEDSEDSDDEDGAAHAAGGMDEDARKLVDALRTRANETKSMLVAVLDAVDKAKSGAGEDAGKELEEARARAAALEATGAETKADLEQHRETQTKQRARNKELGDQLDVALAEVELLRRQLRSARSQAGQIQGLPPMATASGARAAAGAAQVAAAAANTPGGGPATTVPDTPGMTPATAGVRAKTVGGVTPAGCNGVDAGGDAGLAVMRLEGTVAELKGRLEVTAAQLDDAARRNAQLTGEVRKLTDILGDEGHALHTRPYQSLHGQLVNAQEDGARFRNAVSQLQREGDALRAELRQKSMAVSRAAADTRRAQLAESRVQDCEIRLQTVMAERDEATFRLSQQKETAARQRLNEERALMLGKLQKENTELRAQASKVLGLRADLDAAKMTSARLEAEAKDAKAQAADLKAALERATGGAPAQEDGVEALRQALDAAQRRAGTAEAKAAAAEEALAEKNAESEAFMAEVEAIGTAYEELQADNQRLMDRLTERDGTESKAVTEKTQAQQLVRRLREEKEGLEKALLHERGAAQAAAQAAAHTESTVKEQALELARAREESSQLSVRMDEQTQTLRQLQATSRDHREALEASQRQAAQLSARSAEDADKVAAAERKVAQCEEQIAGLKRRAEKLLKVGGSNDEFKEEIDAYKSMLRCSVCNDRPKGVVITRCYHMFCKECIDIRLENRDRKCPGCGAAFSASDVKAIYF